MRQVHDIGLGFRGVGGALVGLIGLLGASAAFSAGNLIKPEEAIEAAYPGARLESENVFLTETQKKRMEELSGEQVPSRLFKRFKISGAKGELLGTAYLDSHRVRTVGETVLVILTPRDAVARVEVVSFFEPQEYLAKEVWLRQFQGKSLSSREADADLRLKRGVQPLTGATLTARSITSAVRRVLALQRLLASVPVEGRSR